MKNKGHTGTLFLKGGKYKWSYKHEYCLECKTVKFKHKGNGLCTSCHDKKRKKESPKRSFNLKKQQWKYYYKKRVLLFLEKKEHKKKQRSFDLLKYRKEYYERNKEVLRILSRVNTMRKKGFPCLKIVINSKEVYLPFEGIDKPKNTCKLEDYNIWKKKIKELTLIKKFYEKK